MLDTFCCNVYMEIVHSDPNVCFDAIWQISLCKKPLTSSSHVFTYSKSTKPEFLYKWNYVFISFDPFHIRVRPRFFGQAGHETTYASSGNKHFFTNSCHRQTYQNYEQPPQISQNLYFQRHFCVLNFGRIFPTKKNL